MFNVRRLSKHLEESLHSIRGCDKNVNLNFEMISTSCRTDYFIPVGWSLIQVDDEAEGGGREILRIVEKYHCEFDPSFNEDNLKNVQRVLLGWKLSPVVFRNAS